MSQSQSSEGAPPPSLVGSLSVFVLSDVLSWLASTSQTGEVRVVGEQVDGRLWLADGQLSNAQVGAARTIGQAVFELARIDEGWFYFTVGVVSSSGQPTVSIPAVLDEVLPQVAEWREIRNVVPLEVVVTLSPNPPGHDVQIRSDQWQLLAAIGNSGISVKEALDRIGVDQIVGLRTLRDLSAAGLVTLQRASTDADPHQEGVSSSNGTEHGAGIGSLPPPPDPEVHAEYASVGIDAGPPPPNPGPPPSTPGQMGGQMAGRNEKRGGGLADVALLPPPPITDPWAPTAESDDSGANGVA
jgi:hypothetical protein